MFYDGGRFFILMRGWLDIGRKIVLRVLRFCTSSREDWILWYANCDPGVE